MTLPEYLLIVISKLEIMEQMERDRDDVIEYDNLEDLDAALSKLDRDLEKGQPAKPLS
jgi:hypothetical protein